MKLKTAFEIQKRICLAIFFLLSASVFTSQAQILTDPRAVENPQRTLLAASSDSAKTDDNNNPDAEKFSLARDFRVEKTPVQDAGAEIVTIFMNLRGLRAENSDRVEEIPLFSILRDTFGDQKVENDRLRYVWMMTYTKPSFAQRLASFIPFLYTRTGNKKNVGSSPPPRVMDLSPNGKDMWNKVFWMAFRNLILNEFGVGVKSSILQNRQNSSDYRKAAIARALAVLSLYEAVEGEKLLSDGELKDIQARMWLSDKMFGSFIQPENLSRVYKSNIERINDVRGHNWELLRQYAERQKLYFEPLDMPDGSATHALIWIAQEDLAANTDRKFNSRFLNIKNPWKDSRLAKWDGYKETRWFDDSDNIVEPDTPGARPKTMIPLALYGLDYPKIPILLVDFRDRYNPKNREMSKRVLDDLTRNVLSVSRFGNLPYFFGRYVYDFVTARRGMDVNQASRFRSYSQLKLLLSLDASLDPDFRDQIADRLETVSLNPLENDLDVEVKLARQQYENLIAYARRPDGLAKLIEQDRREEMTRLKHGGKERMLYALGHLLSFGAYTHREKDTPEMRAQLDVRRQLDYHERFLRETADKSVQPEVDSDLEAIKRSLAFVAQYSDQMNSKTVRAVAVIFSATEDNQLRLLCVNSLERLNSPAARKQMLALYENQKLDARWRNIFAAQLNLPTVDNSSVSASAAADNKGNGGKQTNFKSGGQ